MLGKATVFSYRLAYLLGVLALVVVASVIFARWWGAEEHRPLPVGPAGAPPEFPEPVRGVARFIEMSLAGDATAAQALFPRPPSEDIQTQIGPMRAMAERNPGWHFSPGIVLTAEDTALVFGAREIQGDHRRRGVLLFTLKRSDAGWQIVDIDFETNAGAQDDIERFKRRYPDFKVWELPTDQHVAGAAGGPPTARGYTRHRVSGHRFSGGIPAPGKCRGVDCPDSPPTADEHCQLANGRGTVG